MCAAPCGPSSVNSASEQDLSRDDAHDHVRVRADGPARPREMTHEPAQQDLCARVKGAVLSTTSSEISPQQQQSVLGALRSPRRLRTEVLAGSPSEGRVTYITRSMWFGFPDYTTVQLEDDGLEIYGRLRFGQSDQGVNRARVEGWLDRIGAAD